MRRILAALLIVLLPGAAAAAGPPAFGVTLRYEAYARGLSIMDMEVSFDLALRSYQVRLSYHTVGLARLFYAGQQVNQVSGHWVGERAQPDRYETDGRWRGHERRLAIVYRDGQPDVLALVPPLSSDRAPVPPSLRDGAADILSSLAQLVRHVRQTGSCETSGRTFDGRRLTRIDVRTAGIVTLDTTSRSVFAGRALRCDFTQQMLAGFRRDASAAAHRPDQGSVWMAAAFPGSPQVPVRLAFATRWFGDVTLYLTGAQVSPGAEAISTAPASR